MSVCIFCGDAVVFTLSPMPCATENVNDASQPATEIALCRCPHAGVSALYHLAPNSVSLPCSTSAATAVEIADLSVEVMEDVQVLAAVDTEVLLVTSRLAGQTAMYQYSLGTENIATSFSNPSKGHNISSQIVEICHMEPYPGRYAQEEHTIALLATKDHLLQVTPTALLVTCTAAERGDDLQRFEISALITQSNVTVVPKTIIGLEGTSSATMESTTAGPAAATSRIRFAAAVSSEAVALALDDRLLIVSTSSHPKAVEVVQQLRFASEVCALASSGAWCATPLLCVALWDGSVLLLLRASTPAPMGGILSCIHRIAPTAGGEDSTLRHIDAVLLFSSAELAVHAVIIADGEKVVVYHALQSNTTTKVSVAKEFSLHSMICSIFTLSSSDSSPVRVGASAVTLFVRTVSGDFLLNCDITLLDGCERQLPFTEWHCRLVVNFIGVPSPAVVFSVYVKRQQAGVKVIGWLSRPQGEEEPPHLCFGALDVTSTGPHVTARAVVAGTVVCMELSPDQRHLLVLSQPIGTGNVSRGSPLGGRVVVDQGVLSLYNADTMHCLHTHHVLTGSAAPGLLIGALWGPHPAGTTTGAKSRSPSPGEMYMSLLYAVQTQPSAAVGLVIATMQVLTDAASAEDPLPCKSVGALTTLPIDVDAPALSASATAAGELPPLRSTASLHVKTLSAESLVVCLSDNVLRLIGWDTGKEKKMKQIGEFPLENKVRYNCANYSTIFSCEVKVNTVYRVV